MFREFLVAKACARWRFASAANVLKIHRQPEHASASWTAAALCRFRARRDFQKRQRAAAVQNLTEFSFRLTAAGHSFNEYALIFPKDAALCRDAATANQKGFIGVP